MRVCGTRSTALTCNGLALRGNMAEGVKTTGWFGRAGQCTYGRPGTDGHEHGHGHVIHTKCITSRCYDCLYDISVAMSRMVSAVSDALGTDLLQISQLHRSVPLTLSFNDCSVELIFQHGQTLFEQQRLHVQGTMEETRFVLV